jgi:hypothetical protein
MVQASARLLFAQRQFRVAAVVAVQVIAIGLTAISARGAVVLFEGFNDDGEAAQPPRYTTEGRGDDLAGGFWAHDFEVDVNPDFPPPAEGAGFWVGADMNNDFGGFVGDPSNPRVLELAPIDLTSSTGVTMTVSLANFQPADMWETADFLTILLDKDNNGRFETTLAEFNGGNNPGDTLFNVDTGEFIPPFEWVDFEFSIPDDATIAVIRFEAMSTFNDEIVGIDNIRITDASAGGAAALQAGDADQDLDFDQLDLVRVQIAAKYLTGQQATWGQGDWNGAPGGSKGNPPVGNGRFDQLDIIAALGPGHYLKGPYAAVRPDGQRGDGQTSVGYNPGTGELLVDAPAGTQLTSINIDSAGRIFTGDPAQNLGGSFDNDADNNIFKATFGSSFGSLSFGNVAQKGLSRQFLLGDLTVVGSLAGGGALGDVDLIYVPEPSSLLLFILGLLGTIAVGRIGPMASFRVNRMGRRNHSIGHRRQEREVVMNRLIVRGIIALAFVSLVAAGSEAANILIMNQAGRPFDDDLMAHFESRGHTVDIFDTAGNLADVQIDEANAHDLIYIAESLGSSTLTDGVEAYIKDVATPIIVAEAFIFDDFAMTGDTIHEDFGNTFRAEPPEPALQDGQDSLVITDPAHPMAAGLRGTVPVYKDIYSLNFGFTANMGTGVNVVATVDGAPEYATLFVYEKGAKLEDGTTAAERRIGFYLGQGSGDPQWDNLHANGIAILNAAVDYALGLLAPGAPALQAGDADQDLDFDQLDLVRVQIAAKYLTGQPATWGQGDWNGAPGGSKGSPPAGNGRFDQLDIIAALGPGHYLKGPYAAVRPGGRPGDGQTSLGYNPGTGELSVDAPAGTQLTSINIDSAGRIFTGDPAQNLGGSFDNDADNNIFKATFGSSFGSLSFGNVAQKGLSQAFLLNDLTVVGSLAGGGALGDVDLYIVPEPSAVALAAVGLIVLVAFTCRRCNAIARRLRD